MTPLELDGAQSHAAPTLGFTPKFRSRRLPVAAPGATQQGFAREEQSQCAQHSADEPGPYVQEGRRGERGEHEGGLLAERRWRAHGTPISTDCARSDVAAQLGGAERLRVEPLGRPAKRGHMHPTNTVAYRSDANPARSSEAYSSGTSQAAKCPPRSISL